AAVGYFDAGAGLPICEQASIGYVQDEFGGLVVGNGVHARQCHPVVAAGFHVLGVSFEVPGGLPVGGHVGLFAVHPGALPQLPGLLGGQACGAGVEIALLGEQVDAAGGLGGGVGLVGFALVVVVMQILVRHGAERSDPVGLEQPAFLEGFDQVRSEERRVGKECRWRWAA